jgi:hypothetical protein
MSGPGQARLGKARHGRMACHGQFWQGVARIGEAGAARSGRVRHGEARPGALRQAWRVLVRSGWAGHVDGEPW